MKGKVQNVCGPMVQKSEKTNLVEIKVREIASHIIFYSHLRKCECEDDVDG